MEKNTQNLSKIMFLKKYLNFPAKNGKINVARFARKNDVKVRLFELFSHTVLSVALLTTLGVGTSYFREKLPPTTLI